MSFFLFVLTTVYARLCTNKHTTNLFSDSVTRTSVTQVSMEGLLVNGQRLKWSFDCHALASNIRKKVFNILRFVGGNRSRPFPLIRTLPLTTSQVATSSLRGRPSTHLRTRTHLASQEYPKEQLHIIINARPQIGSHLCQFFSIQPDLCWGRSTSIEYTCFSRRSFSRAHRSRHKSEKGRD